MKNVMVRAWEIAKEGQRKFGGKVSEYFAMALKMAWAEEKAPKKVVLKTAAGSRNHKSWVAKINGTHPTWKFDREFVNSVDHNWIERYFELENGIYEVCDAGSRRFIKVESGQINDIEEHDVKAMIA